MSFFRSVLLVLIGTSIGSTDYASAQLFGPRSIGRNARGQQLTTMESAGSVEETRRFVRGQRAANDFVGGNREDAAAFVGNTQVVNDGEVVDSITGLREQTTARVNRARVRRATGLYAERLTAAFSTRGSGAGNPVDTIRISVPLHSLSMQRGFDISVSPMERSATLTGTVPTEHDRQIAEILVMFEPGLESVRNDLQVAPE